ASIPEREHRDPDDHGVADMAARETSAARSGELGAGSRATEELLQLPDQHEADTERRQYPDDLQRPGTPTPNRAQHDRREDDRPDGPHPITHQGGDHLPGAAPPA